MRPRESAPRANRPVLALLALLAAAGLVSGQSARAPEEPVAVVAGVPITEADLEERAGARLFTLKTQQYQLKRQLLEELIGRRLLENEAASRKLSVEELARLEVEAKVAPVTVESHLRQQRLRERRAAFLKELRGRASVRILLEPPRLSVGTGDDPAAGPIQAPVTIIEFSDFQCPYCARVKPTLRKLREAYGDKVRVVFRDFPLLQIHKDAGRAAEAASCARDQDKFWEMHDRLFANQARLGAADLKQHAAELRLDTAAFDQCLDSGKHAAEWKQDADEASRLGLTGTPAFFINGRLLVGAQPYEAFAQVIDEELERVGQARKGV